MSDQRGPPLASWSCCLQPAGLHPRPRTASRSATLPSIILHLSQRQGAAAAAALCLAVMDEGFLPARQGMDGAAGLVLKALLLLGLCVHPAWYLLVWQLGVSAASPSCVHLAKLASALHPPACRPADCVERFRHFFLL